MTAIVNIPIQLDLSQEVTDNPRITVVLGDADTVAINATVTDDGNAVSLAGWKIAFSAALPDGNSYVDDKGDAFGNLTIVDAAKGRFDYIFPAAAFSIAGKVMNARFRLYKADSTLSEATDVKHTCAFSYTIDDDPLQGKISVTHFSSDIVKFEQDIAQIETDITDAEKRMDDLDAQITSGQIQTPKITADSGGPLLGSAQMSADFQAGLIDTAPGLFTAYTPANTPNAPTSRATRGLWNKTSAGIGWGLFVNDLLKNPQIWYMQNNTTIVKKTLAWEGDALANITLTDWDNVFIEAQDLTTFSTSVQNIPNAPNSIGKYWVVTIYRSSVNANTLACNGSVRAIDIANNQTFIRVNSGGVTSLKWSNWIEVANTNKLMDLTFFDMNGIRPLASGVDLTNLDAYTTRSISAYVTSSTHAPEGGAGWLDILFRKDGYAKATWRPWSENSTWTSNRDGTNGTWSAWVNDAQKRVDTAIGETTAWTSPALKTGFGVFSTDYPPRFRKKGVRLQCQGVVSRTTAKGAIFTLPVGYRPATRRAVSVPQASASAGSVATLYINTSGDVELIAAFNDTSIWIEFEIDLE
ncbi:BppU family phage baseplate upper protein [Listeria ilorinensis]|uniref:BppU family phage baseplate upper protein n=1 Tax=Listeria ilorinensis TaxID=2867439 RepID=UPI001EF53C0E|nr:BppU family phage baseplate upper protein [Listeria ilorinensis]